MRLLLVEDEEKTSTYLSRALSESGFTVNVSADSAEGLHYALEFDYDAIILDVMLPGMDGYRVLEGVRAVKQTPVLMLSARGSVDERVKGLRLGADDYLVFPARGNEVRYRGWFFRSQRIAKKYAGDRQHAVCCTADSEADSR